MRFLTHIGRYSMFLGRVFRKPEKINIFISQTIKEASNLGFGSLGIVAIISGFIGVVITLQTAYNLDSGFIPKYIVGYATRQSVVLEFSTTVVGLILAGKVGSNIASEIGSMRVTEQIDAMEIMGVNSANYLVLPKVVGMIIMIPFITILSMCIGVAGGWLAGMWSGEIPSADFIGGVRLDFDSFHITYALIKSMVFSFLITTISAYQGYYVDGGSLEVGVASTRAVVVSSIQILVANLLLTELLLA